MGKKTPLYNLHLKSQAKIVDFAGWDMPLHYGSQVQEHHAVRQSAGVFDVSHMTILDCHGENSIAFLKYLLANNIDKLINGKALYTCLLNEQGGIIDDLIVYKLSDTFFRLIVNSATHDKDIAWISSKASPYAITLTERTDLAMIAVQGPKALTKLAAIFPEELSHAMQALNPFHAIEQADHFIARTGYTGEEGVEIIVPASHISLLWERLLEIDIQPCGLGARDTLRLEAGLNLYGADMNESVTPFESNLNWTVSLNPKEREFIGRQALENQLAQGITHQLVGLFLDVPGVLRNHQKVYIEGEGEGEITSGSFSPTLQKGIALARLPLSSSETCYIDIRGKKVPAHIVKPPFVHQSKKINSIIA